MMHVSIVLCLYRVEYLGTIGLFAQH